MSLSISSENEKLNYNFINFLLYERTARVTHINWIGQVNIKPRPNVGIPITRFIKSIINPPHIVAYSIPIGPNIKYLCYNNVNPFIINYSSNLPLVYLPAW